MEVAENAGRFIKYFSWEEVLVKEEKLSIIGRREAVMEVIRTSSKVVAQRSV